MRRSPDRFQPMDDPNLNTHPMIRPWQKPQAPVPQQYSTGFKPFPSAPTSVDSDLPRHPGSPHSPIDSPVLDPDRLENRTGQADQGALKKLMMDVVASCLAQRALCSKS